MVSGAFPLGSPHAFLIVFFWASLLLLSSFSLCEGTVLNALGDPLTSPGSAQPCCTTCDLGTVCPRSMRTHSSSTLQWEDVVRQGSVVTIPCGVHVTMDRSANLTGLIVRGHLHFSDRVDLALQADYIYVCGTLSVGTPSKPHSSKLEITLTDNVRLDQDGIQYGSQAFAVFGGFVYFNTVACNRPSWVRLAQSAYPGDQEIKVDQDVSQIITQGDRLVVTSTDYNPAQAEEVTVLSVRGSTVTITPQLTFPHSGVVPTRAEVGILSRNVKIHGAVECEEGGLVEGGERVTSKPICGHFILSHTPHGVVCGVEFSRLGSHTTIGKYPLHAHMCGKAPQLLIRSNAIHHTFQRSVVIHSTSFATIANNVAYHSQGHMYVFENGFEVHNNVTGNLGVNAFPPNPPWECGGLQCGGSDGCGFGVTATGTTVACGSRDDQFAEIFWVANPLNNFLNNVAVGGYRSGFSFYPVYSGPILANPEDQERAGLPEDQTRMLITGKTHRYKPSYAQHIESPGGEFRGNVVHSTRFGFSVYPQWSPPIQAFWHDLLAYKVFGSAVRVKNKCKWDDPCFVINNFTSLSSSMVVRARDIFSHILVTNSQLQTSDDPAFVSGGCFGEGNSNRCEVRKRNKAVCGENCPGQGPVSLPLHEYGTFDPNPKKTNHHHQRRVKCFTAPLFYGFNFDKRAVESGSTSEKCKLGEGSCYDDHTDSIYNRSIQIDSYTLRSLQGEGKICNSLRSFGSFTLAEEA